MQFFLLLAVMLVLSTGCGAFENFVGNGGMNEWDLFRNYMQQYNKSYGNGELMTRFSHFRNTMANIWQHEMKNATYKLGLNRFSDMSADEFKKFVGGVGFMRNRYATNEVCKQFVAKSGVTLPVEVDWRQKGAVTAVKNQGQCGSCWAFSSTGAIEGAWAIAGNPLVDLSEQELVDCSKSYGNLACNGGLMDNAFDYVIDHGQCLLSSYSYVSGDTKKAGSCGASSCVAVAHLSGCYDVSSGDQLALKAAVAQQPVSIAIEADTRVFQSYTGGVITGSQCGTNLDHGVLIVGYGVEGGVPYWLVKNSWGPDWGEDGYVKIQRDESSSSNGVCGVGMQPSFPVV